MKEILIVIEQLRKIYDEITVHEGDEYDYLGMIMTHNRENKSVRINMEKYIEGVIDVFLMDEPDEPVKIVATPATNNLFKDRNVGEMKLWIARAGTFYATVAKR
jgi:hypothetical protein